MRARSCGPGLVFVLAIVGVGGLVRDAFPAHGTVSLSWDSCAPIVTNIESPAPGPVNLFVSVTGNDQTHKAYEVHLLIHGTDDQVPDAWRFDAAGCQRMARIAMYGLPPTFVAKSCPAFSGAAPSVLQIREYKFVPQESYPYYHFPSTWMVCTFASAYPAGNTTIASQRYHLVNIVFDHTSSIAGPDSPLLSCGGFERPLILTLGWYRSMFENGLLALYQRSDGPEFRFDRGGNETVVVNGSLPAVGTTWGQVKSAYRR